MAIVSALMLTSHGNHAGGGSAAAAFAFWRMKPTTKAIAAQPAKIAEPQPEAADHVGQVVGAQVDPRRSRSPPRSAIAAEHQRRAR